MVCVCNATYCDTLDPVVLPAPGTYVKYERIRRVPLRCCCPQRPGAVAAGPGQAAAILLLRGAAQCLSRSTGIEYNLLRIPMACSDFSVRPYSYDDVPDDYELKHFRLAEEDVKMKIPLLQRASAMSKRPLSLYGSPWTAPAWMKSNGDVRGKGTLKGQAGDKYHKTWANYFIKFLDEYAKHNVTFWAVTAQNEPLAALLTPSQFPTIVFTAEQQRDFVVQDLGPALANSSHRTRLIILDDQRIHLPHWAKVVKGKATLPGSFLSLLAPSHPILLSPVPSCPGPEPLCVRLDRLEPGPGHEGGKDIFYKQPMFYHMGHFSKFIPEGSRRVGLQRSRRCLICQLEHVAVLRPDGALVLVVLNRSGWDVPFGIQDPAVGFIETVAPANSIQTYLWRQQ
uniref:Glucosylceramidase n=1 Tax=Strigops habroptila TaxID=2489341 RepID=A0A672UVE1_STRHB